MRVLLLLAALSAPAAQLSKTDQEVVAYVLKTDVPDMDPAIVRRFLELDLALVKPAKRRREALGKKLAIDVALKLHMARRQGLSRTIPAGGPAGCVPEYRPAEDAGVLLGTGFEEIESEVADCVEARTKCTETDLMCEFTLNVTVKKTKSAPLKRFFIHAKDPLMTKVAECRGKAGGQTNFFGSSGVGCSRS